MKIITLSVLLLSLLGCGSKAPDLAPEKTPLLIQGALASELSSTSLNKERLSSLSEVQRTVRRRAGRFASTPIGLKVRETSEFPIVFKSPDQQSLILCFQLTKTERTVTKVDTSTREVTLLTEVKQSISGAAKECALVPLKNETYLEVINSQKELQAQVNATPNAPEQILQRGSFADIDSFLAKSGEYNDESGLFKILFSFEKSFLTQPQIYYTLIPPTAENPFLIGAAIKKDELDSISEEEVKALGWEDIEDIRKKEYAEEETD